MGMPSAPIFGAKCVNRRRTVGTRQERCELMSFLRQLPVYTCLVAITVGCGADPDDDGFTQSMSPVQDGGGVGPGPGPGAGSDGSVAPASPDSGQVTPPAQQPSMEAGTVTPKPGEGGTTPVEPEPGPSAGCLDGITNYKEKGKFTFKTETSGAVKIWVPDVPAGCKVPVVHLANGTGASCSSYGAVLTHLASHGFLATCYENTNTGQGTQCIMALETTIMKHPELADNKIGSTGHSQGGGAAFMCLQRAEEKWGDAKIYAGHSMEPASGFGDSPANWASFYAKIKSPMFMFNGSSDILVSASWVGDAFNALPDTTESYWYEATGAAHIPVPTSWTQESAVAWFRWKLLGDKAACEYFKKMPDGDQWNLRKKQAEKGC
jgi:predicted alpha/beta-hydrolase family hydrolase